MNKIFPTIIIVLMLGASIVYVFDGNVRQSIYWLAAAVLNIAVTY